MPKGNTFHNDGGQSRTTFAPCGWSCCGHPNEVNKKKARHNRLCDTCRGQITNTAFNSNSGLQGENGKDWKTGKPMPLLQEEYTRQNVINILNKI
jgi:hypothetical protein